MSPGRRARGSTEGLVQNRPRPKELGNPPKVSSSARFSPTKTAPPLSRNRAGALVAGTVKTFHNFERPTPAELDELRRDILIGSSNEEPLTEPGQFRSSAFVPCIEQLKEFIEYSGPD